MTNDEIPSSDILAWFDIYFVEPLQKATIAMEDNVEDFNDDNIGRKMNRQVSLKELSLPRVRLKYD